MKSITRILLESGYTKKDIKRLQSDCNLLGYDFKERILLTSKKFFYATMFYMAFFFILSFIVNLLGESKSFTWFFIVIITMYIIPLINYE
ncbi:hypothetical protein, partial [Providencia stuartii]|uniref:hypothetical protein n=1 Tax=Providencia stuartii TaxID=588 RepID=UPI001C5C9D9D